MPSGPVPERFSDLLESCSLGHLATVSAEGKPQVNPVWFIADRQSLYLSVKADTAKLRNMRANPSVALSISDPANPGRYVELRGEVVDLELFDTLEWVNHLARKYIGADFSMGANGEHRYKVTIGIDGWSGQG
ncbi:MAG: PPOX class F420-dependent oxidoreductase [Thermomicrobiales bacterium]